MLKTDLMSRISKRSYSDCVGEQSLLRKESITIMTEGYFCLSSNFSLWQNLEEKD